MNNIIGTPEAILRGCAVFVFDGSRDVLSEWWRVLLEELTFAR